MSEPEKKTDQTAGPETSAAKPDLPPGAPGRVIPLKFPLKVGDKTVFEVVFGRRPKAKDLIQNFGTANAAEQELYAIATLLGINPEDLKEMDGGDYLAVQKEWSGFLALQ